jgi:hypothetical protein
MIRIITILTFVGISVVGNAWLWLTHGYANNGLGGKLNLVLVANKGGKFKINKAYFLDRPNLK